MNKIDVTNISKDRRKQLLIESKKYAEEKLFSSWWVLGSTTVLFVGLIAIAALGWFPWYVRLIAGCFAGLINVRLFVIYHDHQHGTILRDSWLAKIIMNSYGCLALNPPSIWKHSHDHHHKNNSKLPSSNIGSFPLLTTESYSKAGFWARTGYRMVRHPFNMMLGYVTVFFFGTTVLPFLRNPKTHWDAGVASLIHVTLLTLLFVFAFKVALFCMIIPMAIAGALGAYLFYAQHNFPAAKLKTSEEWDYVDAALQSSSFIKMHPLMHWFTGNIGYHHVHHLNHKIPFYRLKEAMKGIRELQVPGTTSLAPRDVMKCLSLKLWDPKLNKLVPLSALKRYSVN